jgi:hypothetical protein
VQPTQESVRFVQRAVHTNTEHGIIAKVEEDDDSYCVTTTSGIGFGGIFKPMKMTPQVGQRITFYLNQGSRIQGIDLDGKELFFKTKEELEAERLEGIRKMEAERLERKQKFDTQLADPNSDFNQRLAMLPKVFRQRFQKFFRLGDDFWDQAWYELVACETAVQISYACRSRQNIRKFYNLSSEEQRAMIPNMDDGLTGNMFGFACMTANFYLRDPKLVRRIRGALSPLVGSKPYIGK